MPETKPRQSWLANSLGRNVKVYTGIPETCIEETSVGVHKTYLDTLGRTAVVVKARNLVDDFRDRDLIISYETSLADMMRKPMIVFCSMLALLTAAWALGKVEVGFSK